MPGEQSLIMEGLIPVDKQELDFDTAPRLKQPRKVVDKPYLSPQAAALSGLALPGNSDQAYLDIPEGVQIPGMTPSQAPQAQPGALPNQLVGAQVPLSQVPQSPLQAQAQALPEIPQSGIPNAGVQQVQQPLPDIDGRLASLFGQQGYADPAAARLQALEERLMGTIARLEGRLGGAQQASPYELSPVNQGLYDAGQQPAGSQQVPGQNGAPITRGELQRVLGEHFRQVNEAAALSNAHTVSRMEAERSFPDVFQNPSIKAVADRIWALDEGLRRDPRGPLKAAMMARGLAVQTGPSPAGGGALSVAAKTALAGMGATIPEGVQAPDDRATQYARAIARFRASGDPRDYAMARKIHLGIG